MVLEYTEGYYYICKKEFAVCPIAVREVCLRTLQTFLYNFFEQK